MPSRAKSLIPYALLALAVFVAYGNVYGNAFLLDDEFVIVKNTFLRGLGYLPKLLTSCSTAGSGGTDSYYRPLQGLLYFIVHQIGGLSTIGFHFLNVALHAANAVLVFTLGQRLNFGKKASFVAALLWALHPLHTEAITYMSSTIDPLYAMLCLLALCVMLPDFKPHRIAAGCALFALALLSKETAIVFPGLAMLCLFLVSPERKNPKLYIKTIPLWAIAFVYLAVRFLVLHQDDVQFYKFANVYSNNFTVRVCTFLATLPAYAFLFLCPIHLHIQRNFPVFLSFASWPVALGAIMALAAAALFVRPLLSRQAKGLPLSWGVGWFAVAHSLHTGVLLAVNGIFYEHWLYLPSVGLLLGLAQSVMPLIERQGKTLRIAVMTVAALCALALGTTTFRQNRVWRDPVVFYENILSFEKPSVITHNNMAMVYSDLGNHEEAIRHYRAAIALMDDTFPQPHYNLAQELLALPDRASHAQEALAELERSIAIKPDFYRSYLMLADIYESLGDRAKARVYRERGDAILKKR